MFSQETIETWNNKGVGKSMSSEHRTLRWSIIGTSLVLLCLSIPAYAQQMKILRAGEGGGFLIAELMTFIGPENNQLVVTDRMPTDRLPKEYQAVDIRQGDIILMANGKKVSKPDELEKLYESLTVGQELKLGIKRGSEMLIASFKKADPATLPMTKRIVRVEGDSKSGQQKISVGKGPTIDGDAVALIEIGVILAAKNGKVTVGDVLPLPGLAVLKSEPKVGDLLVSLQGRPLTTAEALQKAWDNISVGDTVRLVLSRDGKETLSVFAKPKATGEVKLNTVK